QSISPPSYNQPWEVEVVFLPFPLKGIWMAPREFPSQRNTNTTTSSPKDVAAADNWTQLPNTHSGCHCEAPPMLEWAIHDQGSEWLPAPAWAPGRIIAPRFRSRGLIRTAFVRGPDARSVRLATASAFGDVLDAFGSAPRYHASNVDRHDADLRIAKYL